MTLALILGPTACATVLAARGRSLGASGSIILSQTIHTWAALIAILTSIESNLYSITSQITINKWIELEGNTIPHQLLQDKLSSNMNWIIEIILLWVLIYSISYLRTDPTLTRYLITMNLFASSMHTLTNASGPIMMFIGWEWVGLSSYLLISYYTSRHASSHAAMKAILMNRIGDYSILIAAMISITWAHCTQWSSMTSILPILNSTPTTIYIAGQPIAASQLLAELILIAAVGKSAQLSQTSWLMDAMEGPTPVSAILHAATMIVAGAFSIIRITDLSYSMPQTNQYTLYWALSTSCYAAITATVQTDIKRIIALSTCSHIGLIMAGTSLMQSNSGLYHLTTHALSKATIFMAAGTVIHLSQNNQDLRSINKHASITQPSSNIVIALGALSLSGLPGLATQYSKETVLLNSISDQWNYESISQHNQATTLWTITITAYSGQYTAILCLGLSINTSKIHRHQLSRRTKTTTSTIDWPLQIIPCIGLISATVLGWTLRNHYLGSGLEQTPDTNWSTQATNINDLESMQGTIRSHSTYLGLTILLIKIWIKPEKPINSNITNQISIETSKYNKLQRDLGNKSHWDLIISLSWIMPWRHLSTLIQRNIDLGILQAIGHSGLSTGSMKLNLQSAWAMRGILSIHLSLILGTLSLLVLITIPKN
nr:NADH dehydrogenase subunit 5 [Rhodosorus marinus]